MTEKMVSLILGAGRAMGLVLTGDEPSHIHVVRPSRFPDTTAAEVGAHRSPRRGDLDRSTDERADSLARLAPAA